MSKDYYKILGLERNASTEEVRKAFHKLAHKYHPDKKGGDEQKFKEVNEAYQILSNDKRRAEYDAYGQSFASQGDEAGFGGFDFSGFGQNGGQAGGFQFDLGELFNEFFQKAGGGGGFRQRRGRDISVDIQVSFAEAVFGTERKILINKVGVCPSCRGAGGEPGSSTKTCPTCNGRGRLNETRRSLVGIFTTTRECGDCVGRGTIPEARCRKCAGHGVVRGPEEITITVPAGISSGEMIRISGRGEAVTNGLAGDLYVKIHIEKHPIFKREGEDLLMTLDVRLSDALLGAEYAIRTLDGGEVKLKIPPGISTGEILRLRGHGATGQGGRRGDLLVEMRVKNPSKLSRRAKKLVEELKEEGV